MQTTVNNFLKQFNKQKDYRPFHLGPYSSCRPWMTSLGDTVDNADTIEYTYRGI
jgi:hypothetical protein